MIIDVKDLKQEATKRTQIIKEYEGIYLNLYNQLIDVTNYWEDKQALQFKEKIEKDKQNIKQFIEEVKTLEETYQFIIEKYEALGQEIKINLAEKNAIINRFNTCQTKITNIINKYNSLNLSFCPPEKAMIQKEKNILYNDKKNIEQVKEKIITYFNNIENIEKEITSKIAKIEISIINENSI